MPDNHLSDHVRSAIPASAAVVMKGPGGVKITYGELIDRSAQFANVLSGVGVAPGDRVAVQAKKSAEAIIFYLAVIRCGGVYLPLNTAYTSSEIDYFLRDAEPTVLVTDASEIDRLKQVADRAGVAHTVALDALGAGSISDAADRASTRFGDIERGSDDLAALLYTSGTTGRSKGAMLTHGNLVSNALALRDAWRFSQNDVLIHALPIFHVHGLFVATNVTMMAGGSMVILPKFDVEAIIAAIPEATCLMGVPTFYTRLLACGRLSRELCAGMRLFVSGSAPLPASTHAAFRRATGHAILERYGMTETNMITSNPYDGERRAGTVGFPLAGITIRLADAETGAATAGNGVGVVEVKGPNVFSGYWRMPGKTQAEFRDDGFFVTGDLGRIDRDGYLTIVGRGKDLIISGGMNIYPKEVEVEIDGLPGVLESAVVGVPHDDLGEGVVAVVVPRSGAALEPRLIREALSERLARFKQPREIIVVDELPRNTMGKIQKNRLRHTYAGLFAGQGRRP